MNTPVIFHIENCLGPLEKEVMNIVWNEDQITVRDVLLKLKYQKPLAYTTVMTIMDNLYKKGFVKRTRIKKTFVYQKTAEEKVLVKNSIANSILEMNKDYGSLKIVFSLATLGFYSVPVFYSLVKFKRNLDFAAGWYSLSLTIFFALLIFSGMDLIQNLKFFGTIDYVNLFLTQPKEIINNIDIFSTAVSESFPVINFSITLLSLGLVIFLAKKLSEILMIGQTLGSSQ